MYAAKKGDALKVVGNGDVKFLTSNGTTATLKNVLFIPELASNLLSGPQFIRAGATAVVGKETMILMGEELIVTGEFEDPFWNMKVPVVYSAGTVYALECVKEHVLVHQRFGHLNYSTLKDLNLVKEKAFWDACVKANSVRKPYRKAKVDQRTSDPLGVLHIDLFGPVQGEYCALVIDEYSDETMPLFLTHKSDFCKEFFDLACYLENQWNRKIKKIRCDGGGEFVNNDLIDWCKNKGVDLSTTNPYSPQQNGIAERRNRTINH